MSPSLSIVIPVYNAQASIGRLVETLLASPPTAQTDVVLVNDGSRDGSHAVCVALCQRFPGRVTYLRLARNFGEHNAVMAGLAHCRGDYAITMDDDFQNPPEEVARLLDAAISGGYDVVYASFREKRHGRLRNWGSRFNDRVATFLLGKPPQLYLSTFRCLSRFLIDEVTRYTGPGPYVDGLVLRSTDNIGQVAVEHRDRQAGQSGYTLWKLMRLWLTMFVNFSIAPLRFAALLGLGIGGFGLVMAVWSLLEKLFGVDVPAGWTTLYITGIIFSGIQLVMLGLLGEYVGRSLMEANRSPQYVVRETHGGPDRPHGEPGA
ncbi:MAG: glycosyltransferase family 2 protein [Solidesulfovibrio sp. DCME]|uniref:glycosyltransferase family 2 protein n=1 Tax=Solidesulfovibrio sp. DCME TaxID=3447380 RepID=UPI003D0EC2BD